jgi:16S rRNA processing protein RimM
LDQKESYITVGILGKTRGIGGELYVTLLSDFPDRFDNLAEILVEDRGRWQTRRIESARVISGRPVLKFKDIDNREDAARLTNRKLAVPRNQVVPLPENTYYVFDLIGLKVVSEDDGSLIGEIVDVQRYPANDAYLIRKTDGQEVLLAAVARFVRQVDLESRKVVIDPAGLAE